MKRIETEIEFHCEQQQHSRAFSLSNNVSEGICSIDRTIGPLSHRTRLLQMLEYSWNWPNFQSITWSSRCCSFIVCGRFNPFGFYARRVTRVPQLLFAGAWRRLKTTKRMFYGKKSYKNCAAPLLFFNGTTTTKKKMQNKTIMSYMRVHCRMK